MCAVCVCVSLVFNNLGNMSSATRNASNYNINGANGITLLVLKHYQLPK